MNKSARVRAFLRAILVIAALAALLVPILPWLLSRSTPLPGKADAIYVFPGQVPERAECAAQLYRSGVSPVVVLSGANVRPELVAVGQPLTDAELNSRLVGAQGVPETARVVLPEGTSTWEDAHVLASWVAAEQVRSVVAVTSPLHSRRALWSLELALRSSGAEVSLLSCGVSPGPLWWQGERSLVSVTVEALKLLHYVIAHFLPATLWGATPDMPPPPAHG